MPAERKTLSEVLNKEDGFTSLKDVFAYRNPLKQEEADFFYTIFSVSGHKNCLTMVVGKKHVEGRLLDHLRDTHLPELSAQDAEILMSSPARKRIYDALVDFRE